MEDDGFTIGGDMPKVASLEYSECHDAETIKKITESLARGEIYTTRGLVKIGYEVLKVDPSPLDGRQAKYE